MEVAFDEAVINDQVDAIDDLEVELEGQSENLEEYVEYNGEWNVDTNYEFETENNIVEDEN